MTPSNRSDEKRGRMPRRGFLRSAAAAVPATGFASAAVRGEQQALEPPKPAAFPGVITRQTQPDNVEFPFPTLNSYHTPNEQFYIRTHFEVPSIKPDQWTLSIEGHVERPMKIGLEELKKLEPRSVTSLLECSGNSRVFLKPPQSSIRWEQGGVGNAEWTGAPLAKLLERAGVRDGAVDVILEGQDKGSFSAPHPETPGEIHYARSLPIDEARRSDVLVAYQMNGEDLPSAHGYPVRAIVAGWYGMASVKWLRRIVVTKKPFHGYFQTFVYSIWTRDHDGLPTLTPVTEIEVKSQIARPARFEKVSASGEYRVFGAAWAGHSTIAKVEVSADGGASWAPATLDKRSAPYAWRFFEYAWKTPDRAGPVVLMARATDEGGRVQPMERDADRRDAVINHVQPIEVYIA